jgi:DNA-binding XRE family transcriptional regulator
LHALLSVRNAIGTYWEMDPASTKVPHRLPIGSHWVYGSVMEETQRDTAPRRVARDGTPIRQIGLAIKALREKDGWTQTALANAVGISQGALSAIESETDSASVVTLNRLARAMRVPVGAIMRDCVPSEPSGAAA